jgi:hypothetical protein
MRDSLITLNRKLTIKASGEKSMPKIISCILIFAAIFIGLAPVSAHLTDAQADEQIHAEARALYVDSLVNYNSTYPELVHAWVVKNFVYRMDKEGLDVNSTTLTWEYRNGDCSEFSLLYEKLLGYYLPATIVHGTVDRATWGHDTVWYILPDGSAHYIDVGDHETWFHQTGTGLSHGEYIVEAVP